MLRVNFAYIDRRSHELIATHISFTHRNQFTANTYETEYVVKSDLEPISQAVKLKTVLCESTCTNRVCITPDTRNYLEHLNHKIP